MLSKEIKVEIKHSVEYKRAPALVAFTKDYFYLAIESMNKELRIKIINEEEGEPTFPLFDKLTLDKSITLCKIGDSIYLKYEIMERSMSISINKLLESAENSDGQELKVFDYDSERWK